MAEEEDEESALMRRALELSMQEMGSQASPNTMSENFDMVSQVEKINICHAIANIFKQ